MADVAVPTTPALSSLRHVELIHTGEWQISTGRWKASRDDLVAAVAALDCKAVRRPVLKLGHSKGDMPLWAGNPTGAPAVGWVDHLTLTNEGHTLVGDFVGMPSWLADIAASAYPDRSVEGTYDFRCQIGHTHPFVLTAVALLGVTPPGVGTLKSLQDVGALYGVAASATVAAHLPGRHDQSAHGRRYNIPGDPTSGVRSPRAERSTPATLGAQVADAAQRARTNPGRLMQELRRRGLADGETIALTDLRRELPDVPRAELDDLLLRQSRGARPAVFAYPLAAAGLLGEEDRAAAFQRGGQAMHLIRILRPDILREATAMTDDDVAEPQAAASAQVEAQQSRTVTRSDRPLRNYWLRGEGAIKIRWGTPGDFTRCVRQLREHVRDPEGLCAEYHFEANGFWPGDRRNLHASAEEVTLPNPTPTIVHAAARVSVDDVRTAYYQQAPQQAWIREFHQRPLRLIVANDADGTVASVDVTISDDGQIAFGRPVPVRVEYVEQGADDEQVAASRMVYASAAESRPDVEAHARHNQLSHGNWARSPGDRLPSGRSGGGNSADAAIRNAYSALTRGDGATIDAGELDGLLRTLTGGGDEAKRANLAKLDVGGYGTLFATDKTDALDRSKMPQLGTNEQEMRPFLDVLRERGVSVKIAELDPTTLKPSQTEISGAKTGKLYGFMAKDGWLPGGLLVTSGDGYVVDGHHRWSGAAAVRASGARPDMTVTGLVVDAPIDEVLQLAMSVARFESLTDDRMAQASAAAPHKPPAAEPDQPTKEDDMSLTEVRQRLGLADDADEVAILAAVDDLKAKAEAQSVAASAAAEQEKTELTKQVQILDSKVQELTSQIAASAAEKRAAEKADLLDKAQRAGKFTPAERAQWEADYDEAPGAVTRVLASIAEGYAVPVTVRGTVGAPIDVAASDDDLEPEPEWLDGPKQLATVGKDA